MYCIPMFYIYYVSPPLCPPPTPFLLRRPEAEDDALEKNPFSWCPTHDSEGGGGEKNPSVWAYGVRGEKEFCRLQNFKNKNT